MRAIPDAVKTLLERIGAERPEYQQEILAAVKESAKRGRKTACGSCGQCAKCKRNMRQKFNRQFKARNISFRRPGADESIPKGAC